MDSKSEERDTPLITFKARKRKNIRQRLEDDDDGNEQSSEWETLQEFREIQKFKKRENHGVNVEDLLKKNDFIESESNKSIILSGLTDKKAIVASELELGNTFSAETNLRDEEGKKGTLVIVEQ